MRIKKILILALTLILLITLCINVFAARKTFKSLSSFSRSSVVRTLKKSPKAIDNGGNGGVVVIERYSGSW